MDDSENAQVGDDEAPPDAQGRSLEISSAQRAQDIEDKYYTQVSRAEHMRGIMAHMQEKYDELRVQIDFQERVLRSQAEGAPCRSEAVEAIVGTPSMGWADLKPQLPYQDTQKPDFRGAKPRKDQLWHRLACALLVFSSAMTTCLEVSGRLADLVSPDAIIPM